MIACVVAPVDQVFPVAELDVRVTDPPVQNVVAEPALIVGLAGIAFTVTTSASEVADVQPLVVTATVYVPAVLTVISCVVAPVDQVFPVTELDVNVTEPPVQNVVEDPAEIVGLAGIAFTATVAVVEFAAEHPPLVTTAL